MRALIVDDSQAARETARAALEDALLALGRDLPIAVASSGVEALKTIASGDVGVLLVDLHMPDLHGLEVLSFWKQREPEGGGCALVVTTQVSERDREKVLEVGARGLLEKPLTKAALEDALRGVLGGMA